MFHRKQSPSHRAARPVRQGADAGFGGCVAVCVKGFDSSAYQRFKGRDTCPSADGGPSCSRSMRNRRAACACAGRAIRRAFANAARSRRPLRGRRAGAGARFTDATFPHYRPRPTPAWGKSPCMRNGRPYEALPGTRRAHLVLARMAPAARVALRDASRVHASALCRITCVTFRCGRSTPARATRRASGRGAAGLKLAASDTPQPALACAAPRHIRPMIPTG